jgi:hypothetical protein
VNLAFPAVLFFLLALPGIVAVRAYFVGTKDSPTVRSSLPDQLAWGIPVAALFHVIWMPLGSWIGAWCDVPAIHLPTVLRLLAGSHALDDSVVRIATAHPLASFLYFFSITVGAFVAGLGAHQVIRRFGLDHRYAFFRFDSPWFYLLSGERAAFPEAADSLAMDWGTWETGKIDSPLPPDLIVVSAVLERDQSLIYEGVVTDFVLDREGNLDYIELALPIRRLMKDDVPADSERRQGFHQRASDPRYYRIAGNFLILKYAEVKELNIDYFAWGSMASASANRVASQATASPPEATTT